MKAKVARIFIIIFSFISVIVLYQDMLLFPGAQASLWRDNFRTDPLPSPLIIAERISTKDGESLESWFYPAAKETSGNLKGAIIFHGNGDLVDYTLHIQQWLSELGYWSYSFDYRGYGTSSGWPNEKGLYLDTDAVWSHVLEKQRVTAENIFLMGISVGTGPASYLPQKVNTKALVLVSPFTSVPDAAKTKAYYKYLTPFIWDIFPVKDHVSSLENTSLIVVHGAKDEVVPVKFGIEVANAYQGSGKLSFKTFDEGDHHNILGLSSEFISSELSSISSEYRQRHSYRHSEDIE